VMAHGGSIEARPGESAGTIFTVWLPLLDESTRPA
jgi:signal transduction histidine kinase